MSLTGGPTIGPAVLLVSPLPPEECLPRLDAVTLPRRGPIGRFTAPLNQPPGKPDPLFYGSIRTDRQVFYRYRWLNSRNTFRAVMDVSLQPWAAGGVAVVGTVGLSVKARAWRSVIGVIGAVIVGVAVTTGSVLLAQGKMAGLPAVLIPLGMAAFTVLLFSYGYSCMRSDISALVADVRRVLLAQDGPGITLATTPPDDPGIEKA